jgi:hypothetical protein
MLGGECPFAGRELFWTDKSLLPVFGSPFLIAPYLEQIRAEKSMTRIRDGLTNNGRRRGGAFQLL